MGLASSRLTVLKLPPQRTIFIMDYMPRCPCGVVLTDLRTQEELRKWAHREGDCWGRRPNGTPYWYFCLRCHLRRWPNDRRYNNRWSTPAPPLWHMACSGVHRLVAGDFYLTCPPPERRRDELAEPRRVRPRLGPPSSPEARGTSGTGTTRRRCAHLSDLAGGELATVREIPRDQPRRCHFAGELGPETCNALGCARPAVAFYFVQCDDSPLPQRDRTLLCATCSQDLPLEVADLEATVRPFRP